MKLAENLPESSKSFSEYLPPRVHDSISDIKVNQNDLLKLFDEIDVNKASHGTPSKIIKWSADVITPLLTKIFNRFSATGIYPDIFKIAKVSPIFKSGKKICGDNYRPISVLAKLNQIFEKLIKSQMVNFLTKHNILFKNQYGFRKGHSTSHAITHINEKLIENLVH